MNRNTFAVLVAVAVSLVAGLGQAQVTCNWAQATGGAFSTGTWSMNTPTNGGSIDYVLRNTNDLAIISITNNLGNPTFLLNGLSTPIVQPPNFYGSNFEFRTSSSGALPFINAAQGGMTIYSGITLTTNLNVTGAGNAGGVNLNGVISGSGSITNNRSCAAGPGYASLVVTNAANTFTGNWVSPNGNNYVIRFANDGAIGSVSNRIILDNNGALGASANISSGPGHVIAIGPGGGTFISRVTSFTWTLTNADTLVGGGGLTIGQTATLAVNAAQPNFTGQVVVGSGNLTLGGVNALTNVFLIAVTNGGTASLNSSNCLASTAAITVNRSGTLALSNAYAAGTATITNQSYGRITLNTNLVSSGGTRLYLSDLSAVSGTDAQLSTLTDSGNVTIAPGAYPTVIHSTAGGTAGFANVDSTNLVYGLVASTNGNWTIGDAVAGQWRGLGAIASYAVGTSANTLTLNGNAVLDALSGTLTISNQITGGNAANTLGIRGAGTVSLLNANNDFASLIQGVGGVTLNAANSMTFKFAPGSNTFTAINNNSTGALVLDGVGSTNVLSDKFGGTAGGTLVFSNGYYNATAGEGAFAGNMTIAGGDFVVASDRIRFATDGALVNITRGSLVVGGTIGIQLSAANGAWNPGNVSCTLNQSGGTVVTPAISLGGTSTSKTNFYNLSGGTVTVTGSGLVTVGAEASGSSLTELSMTGGKLTVPASIGGGSGGNQVFDFSGGTLVVGTVLLSALTSTNDLTVKGILVQNGGTLAPGDIGVSGLTTITGIYSNTVNTTVLAIDIGGTTAANAFQYSANAGRFDVVAISSNAYLNGNLQVNLIEGTNAGVVYKPASTNSFKILTTVASGRFGTFSGPNVAAGAGGARAIATDGSTSFLIKYNAADVTLTNAILNEWKGVGGNWSTVGGANGWTAMDPSNANYIATLGTNGSGTLTLDSSLAVQGLAFTNPTASYTVSGANTLTLDNGTNVITVNDYAGSHAVNVPVVAKTNLIVNVARAGDTLTFGSTLTQSGTGFTLTKTGAGTLTLSGNNTFSGATTVSNGTLVVTSSGTLSNSPTITLVSGATCDVSGVTGGYIVPAGQTVQGTGTLKGPVTINGVIRATLTDAVGGVSGPTYTGGVIIGSGATLDLGTSTNWLTGSTSTYTIIPSGVSGAAPGITLPRGWRVSTSGGALKLVQGYAGTMILCQ